MKQNLLTISRWLLTIAIVLTCGNLFAQSNTIRGIVIDDLNQPLPGVTVMIKGSNKGIATGVAGRFTISAVKGETLVFSVIG
jgi:hypothetical protein